MNTLTMMLFPAFFLSFELLTLTYADLPFLLGDIPIAVKTPYLNAWMSSGLTAPEQVWPTLYTRDRNMGWQGTVLVDSQPYQWMGNATGSIAPNVNFSTTVARRITPTSTIFTIQAGPMKFNATFFSPVEPNDYTRQSIPFTYLFVDGFTTVDGMPHKVQLYSDITCEWVSLEETTLMTWGTKNTSSMVYHHVAPQNPQVMIDNNGQAEDATAYYATAERPGVTWKTGHDLEGRTMFVQTGALDNSIDNEFRVSNDNRPAFAFAIDLGLITPNNQPDPVVWTLGLVRNPLVTYATESGFQNRTGYYWSAYQSIDDVISDFLLDFPSARQRGQTLDDRILNTALEVSPEYAGLAALVTRQIFASMDVTIPASEGAQPSASDVKIFMKDIGMSARTNPVEVIYAALPALLYFNSSIVHDLLLPLFEFQSSSSYTNPYASPDLGIKYPTINGNVSATEDLAIEHCGNMLIMSYAYAVKSGDGSLISQYYPLLQKWGDYLVQNSLHTRNAISADGFGYPNMSNLALKGMLGIHSMGKIDEVVNPSNTTFKDKANELITEWKQSAVTSTHILAQYGKTGTWGLMYNLFPAFWLQTGLIEEDILHREGQFYLTNVPPGDQSYSLDTVQGNDIAYPHWALMTAAVMPSGLEPARNALIQTTYAQANNVTQNFPLPMRYKASTGEKLTGTQASAAQGAVFGIMAMCLPNVAIKPGPSPGSNDDTSIGQKDQSVGRIVGGVIGGLALLLIITSAIFFYRRHIRRARITLDPYNEERHTWQPPITPMAQVVTLQQNLESQCSNEQNNHCMQPLVLVARKQREVLQQDEFHQQQHMAAATLLIPTVPSLISESREQETLRNEVDDLRREIEAIRNIAQPPPVYQ